MTAATAERPGPGDIVEVNSRRVGEHPRLGQIIEVYGIDGTAHFRVRWEDGHETILYPGNDSRVLHVRRRPAKDRR